MATALRHSSATPAPLDPGSLASIRALERDGVPRLLPLLIDIFLEDTVKVINDLRDAVRTGNTVEMQHLAHRLKGSGANFGATRLMATCQELEGLGQAGSIRGASESFRRLEQEYAHVRRALEEIRSANTAP